jgi:hypothetical protein
MHERTLEGRWWLPDTPNNKYGGRLSFSSSTGCRLKIFGALLDGDLLSLREVRVPVIHGSVSSNETGSDITLFDCRRIGVRTHGDSHEQDLRPAVAALGPHLSSEKLLSVRVAELSFTQLPSWLLVSGFSIKFHQKTWKSGQPLKYTLKYRPVRLQKIVTPIGKIKFNLRSLPPIFPTRTYPLQEYVGLEVRPHKATPFREFKRRTLWYLQNFLTFATNRRNTVKGVFVKIGRRTDVYELLFDHAFESDEPAHPIEMLFSYPQIVSRASEVFTRWIEIYDRLGPALNAIYSVLYGNIGQTDIEFLNVVQAAESYDRRMHGETIITAEEHQTRVAAILAASPEEHRVWLEGKLDRSEKPFLNERLARLFDRPGKAFWSRMFSSKAKMKSQLWRIAEWRNTLSHVTSDAASITENLAFMHEAMNQLIAAIKANLLLDLQFSEDELLACFRYNQSYIFRSRADNERER